MPPFNCTKEAIEGTNRYFKRMELARQIDPGAFKAFSMPTYTPEQMERQRRAVAEVARNHPELAPPNVASGD